MDYFWPILVSIIVILIIYGIVSSKIKNRRIRKATEKIFPKVALHIQADHRYNIFLSYGKTLKNVKFIGISPSHDRNNPYLPFPLCQWLVIEKENGRKAYLKPDTVKFYADEEYDTANK